MNDLAQKEEQLLALVRQHGSLGPKQAADALGWTKQQVAQAKEGLKAKGRISTRQGGGMQVASDQEAHKPAAGNQRTTGSIKPVTKDLEATGRGAERPPAGRPRGRWAHGPLGAQAFGLIGHQAYRPKGIQATEPLASGPMAAKRKGLRPSSPKAIRPTSQIGTEPPAPLPLAKAAERKGSKPTSHQADEPKAEMPLRQWPIGIPAKREQIFTGQVN